MRTILLVSCSVSLTVILVVISSVNLTNTREGYGATSGDYRSKASGNWNSISTWEKYNGTSWIAATVTPTSSDGVITIQNGHAVSVTANVTVDEVTVDAGGTLTITSQTMSVANGTGTDVTVNGTLNITNTLSLAAGSTMDVNSLANLNTGGTINFNSGSLVNVNGRFKRTGGSMSTTGTYWSINNGGTFEHAMNAGTLLESAAWKTGSTCEVTGITTSMPNNINQTFYHFTWNCPSQTAGFDFNARFDYVNGDLSILSTGSAALQFDYQGNNNTTNIGGSMYVQGGLLYGCANGSAQINVGGNYSQTGGTFAFNQAGATAYGNTSTTLAVSGNMTISGGTIDMTQSTAPNPAIGTGHITLGGNLALTGTGLITETSLLARGEIHFAGTSIQSYSVTGHVTNLVDYIVDAGATVQTGLLTLTSGGNFTLAAGGHLMIGSPDGITLAGATGNVQVTGTRSYSIAADYTYNAASAQVTGNGLPSTVHNLTINNSSNLTLTNSVSASNIITFTRGIINTGSNILALTNTSVTAITGYSSASYVNGYLRRSVSASGVYDFPVGNSTNYELANLNLSSITGFTSIVGSFSHANPIDAILYPLIGVFVNGIPIEDMLDYGYWTLTPNSLMTGGTYSVTLKETGYSNPATAPQCYAVIKRSSVLASWLSLGTHTISTQTEVSGTVTAVRSNLTSFSDFGIGKGNATLPITLISFDAKLSGDKIKLSWVTGNEINNDFFTVERSKDGKDFETIIRKSGAGNSTATLHYSAMDEKPFSGINYYRLKQTDYDGKFTYSEIKKVKFENGMDEDALKIESIGPNPFHESVNVNYSSEEEGNANVMLLNATGSIIKKDIIQVEKGLNSYEFVDNMNLQTGIYYITVNMNNKAVTKKIIKN
jgi:hypothetical protein